MTDTPQDTGFVLVTSIGSDRPGIVEDLSGWIYEAGGNIEESRMAQLGGEFATIILVSGGSDLESRLEKTREEFASEHGLNVFTRAASPEPPSPAMPVIRCRLRATSLDHPGIVHQVARLLSRLGINIVSAQTESASAPFSGVPVFQFAMVVDVPSSVLLSDLRKELQELGDRERLDLVLTAEGS